MSRPTRSPIGRTTEPTTTTIRLMARPMTRPSSASPRTTSPPIFLSSRTSLTLTGSPLKAQDPCLHEPTPIVSFVAGTTNTSSLTAVWCCGSRGPTFGLATNKQEINERSGGKTHACFLLAGVSRWVWSGPKCSQEGERIADLLILSPKSI
jgi:hypothetical protein